MVVECDESMISHFTQRQGNQRKSEDIKKTDDQVWLFKMVERYLDGTTGRKVVYVVPDRKRETIEPLIDRHVRPGSQVHTDGGICY